MSQGGKKSIKFEAHVQWVSGSAIRHGILCIHDEYSEMYRCACTWA